MTTIILRGEKNTYSFNPKDATSFLGEGGMGRVFKGEGQIIVEGTTQIVEVAVKVLYRDLTQNVGNIERLKRGAEIKIKHDNLIEMLDFVEDGGIYHDISVYEPGDDLRNQLDILKAKGQHYSYQEAQPIINGVLDGLEKLHQNDIIHRDIDPSNIRICSNGKVKLMDFGIVRITGGKSKSLTGVGTLIGKPNYSPPEQIRGENDKINETTDLYALGVTIYEMLTGTAPFDRGNEFDTMQAQVESRLPRNSFLDDALYDFLDKATAKKQENRFQNVREFRLAFNNPTAKVWWFKKKTQVVAASGLVCLLISGGTYMKHQANVRGHQLNFVKAKEFLSVGSYDSSKVYFEKALGYLETDSTKQKIAMLDVLVPAMDDFYNAKYKDAFSKLQTASELGSGDADYYLGELTYNGLGTIKDYNKGWTFTNSAVKKGFKMAYWRIANAYQHGKGVKKDTYLADKYYFEAIEFMRKLADNGDPEALGNLGSMYLSGEGVQKDERIALDYLVKAASKNYAFIQSNLAQMYRMGIGTSVNLPEAVRLYQLAADKGHPTAQVQLGQMYLQGDGVLQNTTKGLTYIMRAANQNYSDALMYLGYLYYTGKYVSTDFDKSFSYTKNAVQYDNDNVTAINSLAYSYQEGIGTDKKYAEAERYYLRAIRLDSSVAGVNYVKIALLYINGGYGLTKSKSKFIDYLLLAEQTGNDKAIEMLGYYYYLEGANAFKNEDYATARTYFNHAITRNNSNAREMLSYMNQNYL